MGKREASVVCPRAWPQPVVEPGGARQPCIRQGATPSVDLLWPQAHHQITSSASFQRLNVSTL